MGRASTRFTACRTSLNTTEPAAAPQHDFGGCIFQLWKPQSALGSRMASITAAFQQRQEQRPSPVGLFSVAKAEAAADPRRVRHDFRIVKIAPDGKCMFRALASGLSFNAGYYIVGSEEEEADADALRMAVSDALCRNAERRGQFKEAMFELEIEDNLGGNVEMQVLSKMLKVPIAVYTSVTEQGGRGGGFRALERYGDEYSEGRKEVALLHTGRNHFDLLTN